MKIKSPERQDRLAAALRKNLKRRKARARSVAEAARPVTVEAPDQRQKEAQKPD